MQRLNNSKIAPFLKIFLLIIFSAYFISISFNIHSHVVNGVTIVHSHFYKSDVEGNPTHEHTGTQIQLIEHISTFYSLAFIVAVCVLCFYRPKAQIMLSQSDFFVGQDVLGNHKRLRAPPVL